MAKRLDWTGAAARARVRDATDFYARSGTPRQVVIAEFVAEHGIGCFKCGATKAEWAKSGISARGPWAICKACVVR